jgi:hypothetical protein
MVPTRLWTWKAILLSDRPNWFVIICLGATFGCGVDNARTLPDVSVVTTYIEACDSSWSMGHCYGPTHRTTPEVFTVIISRQLVLRHGNVHQFADCQVMEPREWSCLDEHRKLVWMHDDDLTWDELTEARQAMVTKQEYYGFWRSLLE